MGGESTTPCLEIWVTRSFMTQLTYPVRLRGDSCRAFPKGISKQRSVKSWLSLLIWKTNVLFCCCDFTFIAVVQVLLSKCTLYRPRSSRIGFPLRHPSMPTGSLFGAARRRSSRRLAHATGGFVLVEVLLDGGCTSGFGFWGSLCCLWWWFLLCSCLHWFHRALFLVLHEVANILHAHQETRLLLLQLRFDFFGEFHWWHSALLLPFATVFEPSGTPQASISEGRPWFCAGFVGIVVTHELPVLQA